MGLRILLADDHELIRVGIRTLLEKRSDVEVIHEAADGRMAVQLAEEFSPNLAIIDVSMPELNGLDATRQMCELACPPEVIILSVNSDPTAVASAFNVGAMAFVLKDRSITELNEAIDAVLRGDKYISPQIAGAVLNKLTHKSDHERMGIIDVLTKREREILQLLKEGKTNEEIAEILLVTLKTVVTHLATIKNKLNVRSIARLRKSTKYAKDALRGFTDIKLVRIPAGKFLMGSRLFGKDYPKNEVPHQVTISKSFCMGIHAVTQGQWMAVMGNNPSKFEGDDNLPVGQVSWFEAMEYCQKLSAKNGMLYRLPTEAEWEYACRAGTKTTYYSGDDEGALAKVGWYSNNSKAKTNSVGLKLPNAWGLYDMHGNVFEWCSDWYDTYAKDNQTDPKGPDEGMGRVIRGGSWLSQPHNCRTAYLDSYAPSHRVSTIGFRVCMDNP